MCSGIASSENPQRFHFIPANWAAKHGVSWAADLKAKFQMVPESSTPCSFFLLQQWQSNSLVPPLYCHKPAPCLQPSQWPAHRHSLAFHLVAASRKLRFIKPFSWAWVPKSRPSVGGRTGLVHMGPVPTHQVGTYSYPASLTPCKRQQKHFWALCWHLMPQVFLHCSQ